MKVSKQRPGECILSTLGAVSNTPLAQIRRRARELSGGVTWHQVWESDSFWSIYEQLKREFGVTTEMPNGLDFNKGNMRRKLPANKRGSIGIQYNGYQSHITPFENKLIYSTKGDGIFTLEEYCLKLSKLSHMSDLRIKGIWY